MGTGTRTPWATVEAERDAAIRTLRGRVLEIGAGDGANFGLLHSSVEWVGLEPARRRRAALAETARSHRHRVARDTEATARSSALEVADVARYAVPVLGLEIPYVLIDARRPE